MSSVEKREMDSFSWMVVWCWLAAILFFPIFWFVTVLLLVYRLLAFLLTGVRVVNVMGTDAAFAQETRGPDGLIGGLIALDCSPDVTEMTERLQQLLVDAKVDGGSGKRFPNFSRYLQFRMGFPVWVEARNVRAADHLSQLPEEVESQIGLDLLVNECMNRPLPDGRPGWEILVLTLKEGWRLAHYDGEEVPRCMLLFRCHHCYADGVSMVRIMCEVLATNNEKIIDSIRERLGDVKQMRRDVMGRLAISSALILLTGIILVPYYYIWLTVTRDRGLLRSREVRTGRKHYCWSRPVPLAKIKSIKLAMSARAGVNITVNDVVMSCVAGALRRFLSTRQEHVPDQLKTLMPVNVQALDRPVSDSNKLVVLMAELATGVSNPLERVLVSKRLADRIKTSVVDWMMCDLSGRISGLVPRPALALGLQLWSPSLVYSNVPGPSVSGNILGSRALQAFAFVPHGCSMGLSISFQSYVDHMMVTAVVDHGLALDVEDARAFVRGVLDELDMLEDLLLPNSGSFVAQENKQGAVIAGWNTDSLNV